VELREYSRAVRRHWLLILLTIGVSVGATAALTAQAAPEYRASTVLFVSSEGASPDALAQRLQSYVALVNGPRVADAVADDIGRPLTAAQADAKIEAQVEPGTVLLTITAVDASPDLAREIATAAAAELAALAKELEPARPEATAPVTITVAQAAESSPIPGNLPRNLVFAAALGALLAAAVTAAREALNPQISSDDDLRRFAGVATVAEIPRDSAAGSSPAVLGQRPDEPRAEALRALRTRLRTLAPPSGPVSFLLTASGRGEGTTLTACGLAKVLTEDGSRVALVDADLRSPGVHRYLDLAAEPGLSEVLAGHTSVEDVMRESVNPRLWVLPAGAVPPNPGELLAAPAMAEALRILEKGFDVVVVDAPPVLAAADAAVLSALTSRVLLVVGSERTPLQQVNRAAEILSTVEAQFVGAVLNAAPRRSRRPRPERTAEVAAFASEAGTSSVALAAPISPATHVNGASMVSNDLGRHWGRVPLG
jgi:capsular exopolysaccharide synthesis family protein